MTQVLWQRYQHYLCQHPELGMSIDVSRMAFAEDFFARMEPAMQRAFVEMAALERGAIANPDEKRMVGHYWLRSPHLAPNGDIRQAIERNFVQIRSFAEEVHLGRLQGDGGKFTDMIVVGIGGSVLGPQFVAAALGSADDRIKTHFFDNTDPDGMDSTLAKIGDRLGQTLAIVISKSGGTPETRNGMCELENAYAKRELNFARHAVAVTGADSELDKHAKKAGWVARLPMWDWVGGRTSEFSAVGLLPAALQGIDYVELLAGASAMDAVTRQAVTRDNPAALLALMWFHATDGAGKKDMVILPYKDRLALFSRYLQQLVMESLGKEYDRQRQIVHQGISVYGNKGSTDQHAYVQQLREGVANFFVTFVEVLKDRSEKSIFVDGEATAGDYLSGLLQGTRQALYENGRESITITIDDVTPRAVGMLIALYERAVGLYASLIDVNAYHQPGVEAGKKAANRVLELQRKALAFLSSQVGFHSVEQIAEAIDEVHEVEMLCKILQHLAANPDHGVIRSEQKSLFDARYARPQKD